MSPILNSQARRLRNSGCSCGGDRWALPKGPGPLLPQRPHPPSGGGVWQWRHIEAETIHLQAVTVRVQAVTICTQAVTIRTQASERGASLESLGLGSGGKAMLLFGEAQHVQVRALSAACCARSLHVVCMQRARSVHAVSTCNALSLCHAGRAQGGRARGCDRRAAPDRAVGGAAASGVETVGRRRMSGVPVLGAPPLATARHTCLLGLARGWHRGGASHSGGAAVPLSAHIGGWGTGTHLGQE